MTKTVLDNGDIAIATLRKPSALDDLKAKYPSDKLHILKLDVVNEDDIIAAFKYAEEELGRIDIVFNNAGYSLFAEVEGTSHEVARKMFDVNFWGAMDISKETIRFFREVNKPQGGKLWNVSSMAGILPLAAVGYYSASKHGNVPGIVLEEHWVTDLSPVSSGRCDRGSCCRTRPKMEHQGLCKLGFIENGLIFGKITLLEFGGFKTRIMEPESSPVFPAHPAYTDPTLPGNIMRNYTNNGTYPVGDTDKATLMLFHKLANDPEPSLRVAVGSDSNSGIKKKLKDVEADITKHESWSDNLY